MVTGVSSQETSAPIGNEWAAWLRQLASVQEKRQIADCLRVAAAEIDRLQNREKLLLDSHTGLGCETYCKVCIEKGYT